MATVEKVKSAGPRRAKRLLVRSAARPRREIIWTELKRRAAAQGFAPQDLERFYQYLSIHLKLEAPEYTEPLQQPDNFFPGLRSQPVYDPAEFAWVPRLVDDFEDIRQELLDFSTKLTLEAQGQGLADRGQWNVLYFYKGGRRIEATTRACPHTSEILASIPGAAGDAGQTLLSVLTGNSHINRHYAPTNVRLRCHLGIVVPDGARIRIGDEKYEWHEGQCLIFDDSFDHEVWNDNSSERVVLIVDFWHPDLTAAERWAITQGRRMRFGLRDILHA
jgi:Aspartyl/Asparaginyl beta-hydroxylase